MIKKLGDLLDAMDLGGWLCLVLGVGIVGVTVLAPAWRENQVLRYEQGVLERQTELLAAREANYKAFLTSVENNDPLLLQRLAWKQLRLKPVEGEPIEWVSHNPLWQDVRVDPWMEPLPSELTNPTPPPPLPDTRLVRWIAGPSRLWVMAFGGWLMLVGLLVNPKAAKQAETCGDVVKC